MISDHQPIYVVKKKQREKHERTTFTGRSYKNFNLELFKERLLRIDLSDLFDMEDPSVMWDKLLGYIQHDLDIHCPIRTSLFRNYRPSWFNESLIEQIKDRDYFYKKAKRYKDKNDWNIAKHLRNVTNRNIKRAKAEFIIAKLEQHKGDSVRFWKTLRKVFPGPNKNNRNKIMLVDEGKQIDEQETANFINEFFINVGNTIIENKQGPKSRTTGSRGKVRQVQTPAPRLSLEKFRSNEVLKLLNCINTRKSSGLSNVSSATLKEALRTWVGPLTHLFNKSIETSSFPQSWKYATVVPIPKGGDKTSVSNLRPISLLPQPGKILEKLLHSQIAKFLETNILLSLNQYGFREKKSTIGAVSQFLERINLNSDKRIPTLVTFIDFKKAFDCVQF